MKLKQKDIFALITIGALAFTILALVCKKAKDKETDFWPKTIIPGREGDDYNDGFIVEKVHQQNEDSSSMKTPLYLTHHRNLLEAISRVEINFHQRSYTLNDICFKPHAAIFQEFSTDQKTPHYIHRLILEINRLSPCLIITPLNCFHDSHRIHSHISGWNSQTDFLNRRLRNEYIEAHGDTEKRPYVKSNYGPELIDKWSEYMFELSSKLSSDYRSNEVHERVKLWVSSMKPREDVCANPTHPCNETMDDEHFLDICTSIQQSNNSNAMKWQTDFEADRFMSQIDCVEDRDKFFEWMQEQELKELMKTFLATEIENFTEKYDHNCAGVYRFANSSEDSFFDDKSNFNNRNSLSDSIITEILLMNPEVLLRNMKHADYVNGFESIWTIERSKKLLNTFRSALIDEVDAFNNKNTSKLVRVVSRVIRNEAENDTSEFHPELYSGILIILLCVIILLAPFTVTMWSGNPVRSNVMFVIRFCVTLTIYMACGNSVETFKLDEQFFTYMIISIVCNLYLTSIISYKAHRLQRSVQRKKNFHLASNFSSLGTVPVDSVKEYSDLRQIQYILAKYTKFQVAQDTYAEEPFNNLSVFRYSLPILTPAALLTLYQFYIDNVYWLDVVMILLPSIIIARVEIFIETYKFEREREEAQAKIKFHLEQKEKYLSRGAINSLFGGQQLSSYPNEKTNTYRQSKESIFQKESNHLFKLSNSTYDLNGYVRFPNQLIRSLRWHTASAYFSAIRPKKLNWLFSFIPLILFFVVLVSGVSFRFYEKHNFGIETRQIMDVNDDLFIDFSIDSPSSNWTSLMNNLNQLETGFETLPNLQIVSNWHKTFERFNKNNGYSTSLESYFKWITREPINWAVTTPEMIPEYKSKVIPSPFKFRFHFKFLDIDENLVERIASILSPYADTLAPRASGILYERYYQRAAVWKSFVSNNIVDSVFIFSILVSITFLFSRASLLFSIVFSLFAIATRLEISALVFIFSTQSHLLFTTFATLAGFIAAWSPFCELILYRGRVLKRNKTKTSPELAPRRRVRVPFVAALDVVQFFITTVFVLIGVAVVCFFVPFLREAFVLPIVSLIGILVCALLNSLSLIIIVRYKMFEPEVRRFVHQDLRGRTAAANICDLTHKLLPQTDGVLIQMENLLIQPISDESKFFAPPPEKSKNKRPSSSEPSDSEDKDLNPGPSKRRSDDALLASLSGTEEEKEKFRRQFYPFTQNETDAASFLSSGPPCNSAMPAYDRATFDMEKEEEMYESGLDYDDDELLNSGDNLDEIDEEIRTKGFPTENHENYRLNSNEPGPSKIYTRENTFGKDIRPMVHRDRPRDPLRDPPILEEYMQLYDCVETARVHPRADQYELGREMSYALVAYCEDPYWAAHRAGNLDPDVQMPPRPRDWNDRLPTPPPYDPNWVAPPGSPPIRAYREALAFHQHLQELENQENQQNLDEDPASSS